MCRLRFIFLGLTTIGIHQIGSAILPLNGVESVLAQAVPADSARTIPVQVIGGAVIVRGVLHTTNGDLPANFAIDFGSAAGLIVPPDRSAAMSLTTGAPTSATLGASRFENVLVSENESAEKIGPLTAEHAVELQQIPIVGVLGLDAFGTQRVSLDIGSQSLIVGGAESGSDANNAITFTIQTTGQPVFAIAETRIGLGSLQVESSISPTAAGRLKIGRPDAQPLMLGEQNLLSTDAFRIGNNPAMPNAPDILLGTRFLANCRVTIDRQNGKLAIAMLRPPASQETEQAYFLALQKNDANALAAFLANNPDHRLAAEGAVNLLQLRLSDRKASAVLIEQAVRQLASVFPVEVRSRRLLALCDELFARPDSDRFVRAIEQMLYIATETAQKDSDARATHDIHARQGALALRAGKVEDARRLLLSAAYGRPNDPFINLYLGDLYSRLEQPTRAWARYVQATLSRDASPSFVQQLVVRGLDRLIGNDANRSALAIDDIELMLEGRTPAFSPPRQRRADQQPVVRLIELFTDDASAGSLGPQLVFDGLRQFYADAPDVQFIAYHFGPAGNTAFSNERARYYGLKSLPAIYADGQPITSAAGGVEDTLPLFNAMLTKTLQKEFASPFLGALTASAKWSEKRLDVRVEFTPAQPTTAPSVTVDARQFQVHAFVRERRVFAIGGNGAAMHYAVARATLTPDAASPSIEFASDTAAQNWSLSISRSALRKTAEIGQIARERQGAGTAAMQTTMPNFDECDVVVFIQDKKTKRIVASVIAVPTASEVEAINP